MRTLALALAASVLAACASEQEQYCETVAAEQERLGEITSSGDPGRALDVLPSYRELRGRAPRDVRDDWDVVVGAYERLDTALDDAGADATYDAARPPADVSASQRRAIERAADQLGSPGTLRAMASVEQHALDVCKTPLSR